MTTKAKIEDMLWSACEILRGEMDSVQWKDYVLSLLFLKYLSDLSAENREEWSESVQGDEAQMERFFLEEEATFEVLYQQRNDGALGEKINGVLAHIENHDSGKLIQVFRGIDFNSPVDFGDETKKNTILRNLLEAFHRLNLRPKALASPDVIADAFEEMLHGFALESGKKGAEFFTPSQVSSLLARLVQPKEHDRIYDPTCGSAGLLIKAYRQVLSGKVELYGQECSCRTWSLASMNLFLHGVVEGKIWLGNTLEDPQNVEGDQLMTFQCVVSHPPFCVEQWDDGFLSGTTDETGKSHEKMSASLDKFQRFEMGVPPRSKGDCAFVLHMLASLDAECGRMAVVLPHGVLFRGGSEGQIRKEWLEHKLLDAVIGLPSHLFYGTGIPTCVLIFRKNRGREDVLFIDASGGGNFEKGRRQNQLRDEDVNRMVQTYLERKSVDKYSYVASLEEMRENDYNLNIPLYVDTF